MKILYFFLFLWVIFALLDPDPATQINADPDPKPWNNLHVILSDASMTYDRLFDLYRPVFRSQGAEMKLPKSKDRKNVFVGAGGGAVILIYGSAEPEPKEIFTAPHHWYQQ